MSAGAVIAALMFVVESAATAAGSTQEGQTVVSMRFPGALYGTLFWTSRRDPPYPAQYCEGIHSDVYQGLEDVVVIAEPLEPSARKMLLATQAADIISDDANGVLDWEEHRLVRTARVAPQGILSIVNHTDGERTLQVFRDGTLVRTVVIPTRAEAAIRDLPEGVLRVWDAATKVEGWVYVTPWPSHITSGNCRYSFYVPFGRYRLRGWHPYGGERTLVVKVRRTTRPPRSDLKFPR